MTFTHLQTLIFTAVLLTTYKKYCLLFIILFCHITAGLSPAFANSHNFASALVNEDYAPICNGSGTIKWISLSSYYQTGKITFVTAPTTELNEQVQISDCSTCTLFNSTDQENDNLLSTIAKVIAFNYQAPYANLNPKHNSTTAKANSRAPPTSC
ncbi:MAG: hypothetical protein ACSHW0_11325 [Thalassotalea sp.]